jgi:23S rRNA (guanine2445-N2)-methyltransferase / 23S rRNA (guanine2069-N7)-methyltransferase
MTTRRFVATCPKGVEALVHSELEGLGATAVRETVAAASFEGDLATGLRACLWSRTASRILLVLSEFDVDGDEALYAGVHAIAWEEHVDPGSTIAVDAVGTALGLTHTGYVARRVKDAVVDRLREKTGSRPSVDLDDPDVRINVRLAKGRGTVSIDLSGEPLHRRGYRTEGEQAEAPLKENLAAAILVRAGWPAVAESGGALLDPMCGSGTLVIEAALMVADQAPGLLRSRWGFQGWLGAEADVWNELLDEADDRAEAGRATMPVLQGRDTDLRAIELAQRCASNAGVGKCVGFELGDVADMVAPGSAGIVVTNPPYGERLGEGLALPELYSTLGRTLAERFGGWRAAVLTSDKELALAIGLRSHKNYALYNGAIAVRLYLFSMDADNTWRKRT